MKYTWRTEGYGIERDTEEVWTWSVNRKNVRANLEEENIHKSKDDNIVKFRHNMADRVIFTDNIISKNMKWSITPNPLWLLIKDSSH